MSESPPPVLLIHGIKDDSRKLRQLAAYLQEKGREVHAVDLVPSWGQVGLDVLAGQVAAFVEATFPGESRFDLVGFSMGGLVARYYLQRLGGLQRVNRFVTISTPHCGSWLAWLLPNAAGRQMRPGSAFLRDLDADAERLCASGFTSIWTPLDLTVFPATSSRIAHGRCHSIWCVAHPLMVRDRRCFELVVKGLS